MIKIKDTGQFEFLFGKKKAQFLRFCEERKEFYQAEVAKELGWSIGTTGYLLPQFCQASFSKSQRNRLPNLLRFQPLRLPSFSLKYRY